MNDQQLINYLSHNSVTLYSIQHDWQEWLQICDQIKQPFGSWFLEQYPDQRPEWTELENQDNSFSAYITLIKMVTPKITQGPATKHNTHNQS